MSFTVFLGNLPLWVTADDIKSWLAAESLVADNVKVIRNPETQESKGFAFIEAPNQEEMNSIIRRFDRAPLEDRLLRANPAQPPKGKGDKPVGMPMRSGPSFGDRRPMGAGGPRTSAAATPPVASSSGAANPPAAAAASGTPPTTTAAATTSAPATGAAAAAPAATPTGGNAREKRRRPTGPPSAFAEELAKAL